MSEIKKFNELFEEFLEKIIAKFPNQKLKTYRRGFFLLKSASPSVPVNLFMSGCIDYKKEIKSRNETFFLKDKKISDTANVFGNFTDDSGLDTYWAELSPSTKKAIWDYIQSLFVLGEMIINKDEKSFEKYNKLYASDYKKEVNNLHGESFSLDFLSKLNS